MKQSDDPKVFYEKYGFTNTIEESHPIHKDIMHFEGLEADYVSRLECDVEHYKRSLMDAMANNERLMSRENWRLNDEIKKLKAEKEVK